MMKKVYNTPQMEIVMLKQQQALLIGSYDGPANAPVINIDEDTELYSTDELFDLDFKDVTLVD